MQLEHVNCNLCGQDDTKTLFLRRDSLTREQTEFAVVKCNSCGLVYVNPRPPSDVIHRFYPKEFVSYQFHVYESPKASLRERLVSMVTRSSAAQRVKKVRRLMATCAPESKPNVLDIGCGKGGFLHALDKEPGWNVSGIDFDKSAVAYCRQELNLNVIQGDVTALDSLSKKYDLVTMWHFLEHDYDPMSALRRASEILKPGGLLVFEVPNAESMENRVFGKNSYLYDVPRHLYDFSPNTIELYLETSGFELQSLKYSLFAGGWMGSFQELFLRGAIYRDLKKHIFSFLLLSQILLPIDLVSAVAGRGSIMTITAKKPRNLNAK